jgi:hypothetical protein
VYVDGELVRTVSTHRPSASPRRIVFTRSWDDVGRHTIRLVVVGTSGRPRVDVDAFVVLR